jgi:hypothetical protein
MSTVQPCWHDVHVQLDVPLSAALWTVRHAAGSKSSTKVKTLGSMMSGRSVMKTMKLVPASKLQQPTSCTAR